MNQVLGMLVFSWVQALVIAVVAILLSRLAMRRSPLASAAIAWTGVLATLTLTLLTPAPIPRWECFNTASRETSLHELERTELTAIPASDLKRTKGATDGLPSGGATLDLNMFRGIARSLQRSQAAAASHPTASQMVIGVLVLGALFSMTRVAYGVWAITTLRRTSQVIDDQHLKGEVGALSQKLGIRRLPEVRERIGLVSAAVVGWWHPTVLFPCEWREWSPSELRAVVAHELAHIVRYDPLARLVTAITVALQWVQPLVYWLWRQLVLAQEMSADELAAEAVGSRAEYVRALSKLALRQDGRPMDGPTGMLLPIFSGFLLRRIEMLRAKDGSTRRDSGRTLQWCATVILIVAAASITALRGFAQPPDDQPNKKKPIRVARSPDPKSKGPVIVTDPHAAAATLFQRPVFDLATAGVRESEGFVLRLGEILRRPEIADQARAADVWFKDLWKVVFPGGDVPAWSLQDIDYIAGHFSLAVKPMPVPTENGSNQLTMGSHWCLVRWQKPVNELFESWLSLSARSDESGVTRKSHGPVTFIELPILAMFGPTKICVCQLDDHTLMFGKDEASLATRLDKSAQENITPTWGKTWSEVEGGLLSIIANDKQFVRPLGKPVDDEAKLLQDLFHARQYAIGMDWQPGAQGVGVLKVQIRFDDQAKAELFRTSFRRVLDEYAQKLSGQNSKATVETTTPSRLPEFLQNVKLEMREMDGGWQVYLQLAAPVGFQELLSHL